MKKQFVFILLCLCVTASAQVKSYFPAADQWERKTPTSLRVDSNLIQQAIQYALTHETKYPRNLMLSQAMQFGKEPFSDPIGPMASRGPVAGVIVYKGFIIAEWGNLNAVEMVNSVTKSMVSTVVGLAVQKGLIRSIEDKVYSYLPPIELVNTPTTDQNPIHQTAFIYPFDSEHNQKINWNHLLRQTSDWEGVLWGKPDWADRPSDKQDEWTTRKRFEPGTVYKYNDTRVILREQVMQPIGASNTWAWTGYKNAWIVMDGKMIQSVSGGGHFGGGLFINAYDMARFGLLTLRKGNWNGKQIIAEDWINQSLTPTTANTGYGFMNYFLNTDKKMYPSAPASAYAHIGNGTNAIYVDRENDIVAVIKWMDDKSIDGFLKLVLTALPK